MSNPFRGSADLTLSVLNVEVEPELRCLEDPSIVGVVVYLGNTEYTGQRLELSTAACSELIHSLQTALTAADEANR